MQFKKFEWLHRMHTEREDAADLLSVEQRKKWIDKRNELLRDTHSPRFPCPSSLSTRTDHTGLSSGTHGSRLCKLLPVATIPGLQNQELSLLSLNNSSRKDSLTEKDQKIIHLMILRREEKLAEDSLITNAHKLWNQEKLEYQRALNDRQEQWRHYVMEKRNFEKLELEHRKKMLQEAYTSHLSEICAKIESHHNKNIKFINQKKTHNNDADIEDILYNLRNGQLKEERHVKAVEHLSDVMKKEQRVELNFSNIQRNNQLYLQERRSKRELQEEAARISREAFHREQSERIEHQRCLSEERLQLSTEKVQRNIQQRCEQLRHQNRLNQIQHARTIAMLKEEEKAREAMLRQLMINKNSRITQFFSEKEGIHLRRKTKALAAAQMRQKIRTDFPLNKL